MIGGIKMGKIKTLLLHNHTDNSVKDGAQTPKELVQRAKELDAPAVTLTDHGVLTGIFEFMKVCEEANIKGIPGVEAYIKEDDDETRRHLVILAKDAQGYKAIEKAVTESNQRLVTIPSMKKDIPTMSKAILKKWFGEGSLGHDHTIATSACVQGVVATELTQNSKYQKIINKAVEKRKNYHNPSSPIFVELSKKLEDTTIKEKELKDKQKEIKKEANLATKKAENYMKKKEGTPDYNEAKAAYDNLIERKELAAKELITVQSELAVYKKHINELKAKIKPLKDSFANYTKYDTIVKENEAKLLDEKHLLENARKEALYYSELFGKNNFFIELQFHGFEDEQYVFPRLCNIAKGLDIPCVPANDAHYTKKEDAKRREMLVADSFKKTIETLDNSSCQLYIKSDEELTEALSQILSKKDVEQAFENLRFIADNCNVILPKEHHYPVYHLPEGETDSSYIRKLVLEGVEKRYPGGKAPDGTVWDQEHIDRMESELEIIGKMGYNHYHLVVQDYLNYGRQLGFNCPEGVGYTIGPGRGSAVGSLVCYLLGITDLDPIKYNLFFERYLNPERVSMPDIDADFANFIREDCIDYMREKYGIEGVCGVTTKGTLGIKAAILLAGRVNPKTHDDIQRVRLISKSVPKGAKHFTDPVDVTDKSKGDIKSYMLGKYPKGSIEAQIIEDASSVEGLTVSFGRHAAAVIISDTGNVSDQVALMSTGGAWAVQCTKEEAEAEVGLLKMDFLGLINLDIITHTLRKIYRNSRRKINMNTDVHFEKEVFEGIFSTGNTDAVFQFSSDGMKQMLKEFRPSSFEDLILLVAAYRPGPMQYLSDIIAVKHGKKPELYTIPELKPILNGTYGKTVYQEQVQEIFKKLAGYSLGQADLVRRAMSKKKMKELEKERESFLHGDPERGIKGCVAYGINEADANKLFDEMMDFASYAFNKSHAAAYAYVAYQTAWLKYNYPTEYMAAVMEHSKYDKLPMYIYNSRDMGLTVKIPDINRSDVGFIADKDSIIFGFSGMKGVGDVDIEKIIEERKKGEFKSFKNFISRTNLSIDTLKNLVFGGAFDCFGQTRKALFSYGENLKEIKSEIEDIQSKIGALNEKMNEDASEKDRKKLKDLEKTCVEYKTKYQDLICEQGYEDKIGRLTAERNILGTFISDHPINSYKLENNIKIKDLKPGKDITVCGLITDFRLLTKKSTGENFCSFNLDDGTGVIQATVFTKAYEAFGEKLVENEVVCLTGFIKEETVQSFSNNEDDDASEEKILKFYVNNIGKKPVKKQYSILLVLKTASMLLTSKIDEKKLIDYITENYESQNGIGYNLLIYDEAFSQIRRTNKGLIVKSSILMDKNLKTQKVQIME